MSTVAANDHKKEVTIPAFGIVADHRRNSDLLLQAIPNCRLRSIIKSSRTVIDTKTGDEVVPQDQARHLGSLPEIPGMQIHVNPKECTYKVYDPLVDNADLCDNIRKRIKNAVGHAPDKIQGVKTQEGKLDRDRMKTLCRELRWIVDSGDARVVKGVLPDLDDIDRMGGRYLLNPGSVVQNTQPRYEDEWDAWIQQLQASRG